MYGNTSIIYHQERKLFRALDAVAGKPVRQLPVVIGETNNATTHQITQFKVTVDSSPT